MDKTCCPKDERKIDFCKVIEKRIRKHIRINKLFKKNDVILVKDYVSEYFLKKIIGNLPLKIVKKGKADKIVGVWTADDEINSFFMGIIGGKVKSDKRFIKMFVPVTDDEMEKYCKICRIDFCKRKKDKPVELFINNINKKYPDSKHKIIKSLQRLQVL